ncbi:MAG: hypothetical protein HZY76_02915 [Anaerolineae bacterium]|nr:MAG: hypothetical protein HZY76_02915 [Anaerolineae bacterium]
MLAGETVLPPLKGFSRLWTPPDAGMLPKAPVRPGGLCPRTGWPPGRRQRGRRVPLGRRRA